MQPTRYAVVEDGPASWLVAAACGWIQIWCVIVAKTSGILLVALMSTFGVSRELASWPFVIISSESSIVSILTGFLLKRYDTRTISIAGTIVSGISILGCFFWHSITGYIVFLGFGLGFGLGLSVPTNVVVISRYFKRQKTGANGINFAGGTFGGMFFPPIIYYLCNLYGLRGLMLIIGGVTFNALAGSFLLRSPPVIINHRTSLVVVKNSGEISPKLTDQEMVTTSSEYTQSEANRQSRQIVYSAQTESLIEGDDTGHQRRNRRSFLLSKLSSLKSDLVFLNQAIFYVITFSGIVFNCITATVLISVVDHSIDRGLSHQTSSFLASVMAAGDITTRLFSGFVIDRKFVQRKHVLLITSAIMGASCIAFIHINSFAHFAVVSVVFSLGSGSTIILMPVLLSEYLDNDLFPVGFGVYKMAIGISGFSRPYLMWYFRDHLGSYDGLYYLNSVACLIMIVTWTAETILRHLLKKRSQTEVLTKV